MQPGVFSFIVINMNRHWLDQEQWLAIGGLEAF
jgi:hypothetical protein